jgi:hypothetical protein
MAKIDQGIWTGRTMGSNDFILSRNGRYAAVFHDDGNLVLCLADDERPVPGTAYWSIESDAREHYIGAVYPGGPYVAAVQSDGNFVIYHGTAERPNGAYWATGTGGGDTHTLMLEDSGALRYTEFSNGQWYLRWSSGTEWQGMRVERGATVMSEGQWLAANDWILARDVTTYAGGLAYMFAGVLRGDGNLVVHPAGTAPPYPPQLDQAVCSLYDWGRCMVGPYRGGPVFALMRSDGNFVIYNGSDPGHAGGAIWATHTSLTADQIRYYNDQHAAGFHPAFYIDDRGVPNFEWSPGDEVFNAAMRR